MSSKNLDSMKSIGEDTNTQRKLGKEGGDPNERNKEMLRRFQEFGKRRCNTAHNFSPSSKRLIGKDTPESHNTSRMTRYNTQDGVGEKVKKTSTSHKKTQFSKNPKGYIVPDSSENSIKNGPAVDESGDFSADHNPENDTKNV